MAKKITIHFGPDSAIVKQLRGDKDQPVSKNFNGKKVTFEFNESSPSREREEELAIWLIQQRSPFWAKITLTLTSQYLKSGEPIPNHAKYMLALAIDRILENGDEVSFLYGKKGRGKPPNDNLLNFYIFQTIEEHNSKVGRLSSSRKGKGAYELAKTQLESEKIFIEEDEYRRIRQEVQTKASKDLVYMMRLFYYIEGMGYKATFITDSAS